MSGSITKIDLDRALDKQTDTIMSVLDTFMSQTDSRFNALESQVGDLKQSIDRLTVTIDGFIKRLDSMELEQHARDAQFERLVAWAKKVSEKTGIPLENI